MDLHKTARQFKEKIQKLKVVLFDVDGVLTDGRLFWGGEAIGWLRFYHSLDGYGFKLLRKAGMKTGIITGGESESVFRRFRDDLQLDYVFTGRENKVDPWQTICKDGHKDEELFYMGDDLFDIPLLKRAGFSATVSHASFEVKKVVDYVAKRSPGMGCARELMDIIAHAKSIL